MPTRINKKNLHHGNLGLPRFFWVMLTDSKGQIISYEEIKKESIFETNSKIDLLEFLADNKFPSQILDVFMSKL